MVCQLSGQATAVAQLTNHNVHSMVIIKVIDSYNIDTSVMDDYLFRGRYLVLKQLKEDTDTILITFYVFKDVLRNSFCTRLKHIKTYQFTDICINTTIVY